MLWSMPDINKSIQAPPWLTRLLTPMIARLVARQMIRENPGLGAEEIIAKMRAKANPSDESGQRMLDAVALRLPARANSAPLNDNVPLTWHSPSSLILIAANLLPLYGVIVLDWPVFPLLLLFWLENVVIGAFNVLRMLFADVTDAVLWAGKLFMIPFFCFHYGMFTALHGSFVVHLFGGKTYQHLDKGLLPVEGTVRAINDFDLVLPLAVLAGSHLFSFLWNYLFRGEFRRAALNELMGRPYKRIIVLHVTIIIGGGITMTLGSPLWALLLLLALKISFDLKAHVKEHQTTVP